MKLPKIEQEPEPKGKRSYRWNIWGNYVGYIGRKRWMTFANEFDAKEWVNAANSLRLLTLLINGTQPTGIDLITSTQQ